MLRALLVVLVLPGLLVESAGAGGPPVARFQSVLGEFDAILVPAAAPLSVTNFASYANRGAYDSTIIHRSTTYNPNSIQIVQGGGFALVGNLIEQISTDPPIPLESGVANSRGTLAMARANDPNSATSQWYFNVTDNPGLDFNYTVFGRVLGGGMSVVDATGNTTVYDASGDLGPVFAELPLFGPELTISNLVLIESIRVAPFAITNFTRSGTIAELRWQPLSTNTPIRVERTTDLAGPWNTIATNLTTGEFTDTNAPAGSAFYRLVTE